MFLPAIVSAFNNHLHGQVKRSPTFTESKISLPRSYTLRTSLPTKTLHRIDTMEPVIVARRAIYHLSQVRKEEAYRTHIPVRHRSKLGSLPNSFLLSLPKLPSKSISSLYVHRSFVLRSWSSYSDMILTYTCT
jgi:hypothetical protein